MVLENFDIEEKAGGTQKPAELQFNNISVINHVLEIRFYWAGKGTTRIPDRGVYGPLISAISVYSGQFIIDLFSLLTSLGCNLLEENFFKIAQRIMLPNVYHLSSSFEHYRNLIFFIFPLVFLMRISSIYFANKRIKLLMDEVNPILVGHVSNNLSVINML